MIIYFCYITYKLCYFLALTYAVGVADIRVTSIRAEIFSETGRGVLLWNPLVPQDQDQMKKILHDCMSAELQLSGQIHTPIDGQTMEEIKHLLYLANDGDYLKFSFFELNETTLSMRFIRKISPRRKRVVSFQVL